MAASMKDIMAAVSSFRLVSVEDLKSSGKPGYIAHPRQEFYFLAGKMSDAKLTSIGMFAGNRHHTTVIYGIRAVEARMAKSVEYRSEVEEMMRIIAADKARFVRHGVRTVQFKSSRRAALAIERKSDPVPKICADPGCGKGLQANNRSGVCVDHIHKAGICRCAVCREMPPAPVEARIARGSITLPVAPWDA